MTRSRIASLVRAHHERAVAALPPAERLELALALGDALVANRAAAEGISRREARGRIREERATARRPSAARRR